ncbi:MAG: phosphotyrosine protein phosphatase [Pseudomonadota bacterium]
MMITGMIKDGYGSKKGFLRYQVHRALGILGRYTSFRPQSGTTFTRLVFVCAGNICRSPFAQVVAEQRGLNAVSIGLSTRGGDPANSVALAVAENRGFSLAQHRSSRVEDFVPQTGDWFVCMEPQQAEKIQSLFPGFQAVLLGMCMTRPQRPFIPDPFGKSTGYFARCFSWIETGVANLNEFRTPEE